MPEPATAERADSGNVFAGWQATSSGGEYPSAPAPVPGSGGGGGYYEYRTVAV